MTNLDPDLLMRIHKRMSKKYSEDVASDCITSMIKCPDVIRFPWAYAYRACNLLAKDAIDRQEREIPAGLIGVEPDNKYTRTIVDSTNLEATYEAKEVLNSLPVDLITYTLERTATCHRVTVWRQTQAAKERLGR